MLKILRNKKTAKKVWIILAIIIIPAFAFWGFGSADKQAGPSVAGRIFGRNVSMLEYKDSLAAVKTAALMRFGDHLPEIEKYLDLEGQAWERLLLLAEAKRRKIKASDKEVVEQIQNAPYFQDQQGFNDRIYQETLRYFLRLQPRIYEEQTRQNLILAKLYEQLTKDLKLTDEQIRQEYLQANQELSIDYIASLFSESSKTIQPTAEEIADYYAKHKTLFKEPGQGTQPVRIPPLEEIKDKVKAAYTQEAAKTAAFEKINACAQNLKKMNFSQAAAASNLKTASSGYFKSTGSLEDLGAAGDFWRAAQNLKNNETSEILTTDQGYYLIKLKSLKPIDENKFNQDKEAFAKRALDAKKSEKFAAFIEQLRQKAQ